MLNQEVKQENEIKKCIDSAFDCLKSIKAEPTVDRVLDFCGASNMDSSLLKDCSWTRIRNIIGCIEYKIRNE